MRVVTRPGEVMPEITVRNENQPRGWASDQDLAQFYSVSRQTIWRWARQGIIPKPEKLSAGVTRWRWEEAAK
jgi:predicted DNA-binding transcriptional regulator AlpA